MGNREQKLSTIESVRERFARATASVFLDFRGITVDEVTELRNEFRKAGVEYKVIKNNLILQAFKGTALEAKPEIDKGLVGQTGVAWSYEDPSSAAKVVKAFRKAKDFTEKLPVKFGLVGQDFLTGTKVETELANLPGKDELRAQLLATLQAPAQNLVRQLNAPGQNFAYLLDARKRSISGGQE